MGYLWGIHGAAMGWGADMGIGEGRYGTGSGPMIMLLLLPLLIFFPNISKSFWSSYL